MTEDKGDIQETFQLVSVMTQALQDELTALEDDQTIEMTNLIRDHLQACYLLDKDGHVDTAKNVINVKFTPELEWINTNNPREDLEFDATSNIVIFDFFTHCCINCIHSIEDLRQVHSFVTTLQKSKNFRCGCQLLSIHSPKFTTEKQTESIRSSVERMQLNHTEVINDPDTVLWQKLGIYCWPTILVFGPNVDPTHPGPNLLFVLTGEGHKNFLNIVLEVALNFFEVRLLPDKIDRLRQSLIEKKNKEHGEKGKETCNNENNNGVENVSQVEDQTDSGSESMLRFPGKVTVFGDLICISDSGNNRIIISDLAGEIQHMIGGPAGGYLDGDFSSARFYNPQGTAFKDADTLIVADTGNHCLRMVDLSTHQVTTIVQPNASVVIESASINSQLKSPWDLFFHSPSVLLVAGAGTHQIFGYFFDDVTLYNKTCPRGAFTVVAGSGKEENRNNMYLLRAGFAQPSGICATGPLEDRTVFIADSESSSIRMITNPGRVQALVGGSRDPQNLFTYGDEDGVSFDVKLQHPLGVCAAGPLKIFLADTYNHKVKMINVETKHCSTLIGDGNTRNKLGSFAGNVRPKRLGLAHPSSTNIGKSSPLASLNEPGGICVDEKLEYLYIADTNNHCVKVGHLQEQIVSELILKVPQRNKEQSPPKSSDGQLFLERYDIPIHKSVKNFSLTLRLNSLPQDFEGGSWKLICPVLSPKPTLQGSLTLQQTQDAPTIADDQQSSTSIEFTTEDLPFVPWMRELYLVFTVLYCRDAACHRRELKLLVNFHLLANDRTNSVSSTIVSNCSVSESKESNNKDEADKSSEENSQEQQVSGPTHNFKIEFTPSAELFQG